MLSKGVGTRRTTPYPSILRFLEVREKKKMRTNMTANRITIVIEAARYLRRLAAELFESGAGMDIRTVNFMLPEDEDAAIGIIDEVTNDSEVYRWINGVLQFMRVLHGILENAEFETLSETLIEE